MDFGAVLVSCTHILDSAVLTAMIELYNVRMRLKEDTWANFKTRYMYVSLLSNVNLLTAPYRISNDFLVVMIRIND